MRKLWVCSGCNVLVIVKIFIRKLKYGIFSGHRWEIQRIRENFTENFERCLIHFTARLVYIKISHFESTVITIV